MSEESGLTRLEDKLNILIRLTALSLSAGLPNLKERAILLHKSGLGPKEIAELCDSTPNTVSVALSNAKKEKKS